MNGEMGALLAFSLRGVIGTVVIYKWPAIRRFLVFSGRKVEKEAVKSYLAVKDGIAGLSGHLPRSNGRSCVGARVQVLILAIVVGTSRRICGGGVFVVRSGGI